MINFFVALTQRRSRFALQIFLLNVLILSGTEASTTLLIHHQDKDALFQKLLQAENEWEGRQAESAIWQYWFHQSPDNKVRELLDSGMKRRDAYDFEAAENLFDEVVKLAPNYSEGYNQRAFARFLRENYSAAQADLEIALELEPNHFAALSGLYHILMIQNRPEAAFGHLQQAVGIHPWLKERTALPESMRPERDLNDLNNKENGLEI